MKHTKEDFKYFVIYSFDCPRDQSVKQYQPSNLKKWTLTEGDDQYEYDYLEGDWLKGKHRKYVHEGLTFEGNVTYDPTTNSSKEIIIDTEYRDDMYIDIESIGIEKITITANVESSEEEVYDKYLKKGVAHFKGTPLPGDGGNSFIYGHSSVESFFSRHQNLPETIFTRLEDIEVGDNVFITRDGEKIHYIVRKKKIVEATDFSILDTQGDKETVTLMTCWPLGIGTKRLIVVAEKY